MFSIIFETNYKLDKDKTLKLMCNFIQGMPMLKLVKKGLGTNNERVVGNTWNGVRKCV
jgi:hypothetical protein